MATKCEKCRKRQREKYLEQRDELKQRRKKQGASADLGIENKEVVSIDAQAASGEGKKKENALQQSSKRKTKRRRVMAAEPSGLSHLIAAAAQQS